MNYDKIEREIEYVHEFRDWYEFPKQDEGLMQAAQSLRLLLDVARAAERVENGHFFAEGGIIPESDWIELMNARTALKEHCDRSGTEMRTVLLEESRNNK